MVNDADPHVPEQLAAVNAVLSQVIDFVTEVKQARWRFAAPADLHAELDRMFEDAAAWARLLVEEDDAHGVSPLSSMPSVAGRTPPGLGPTAATRDGLQHVLDQHLGRLGQHVVDALERTRDEELRAALAEVERGVVAHRRALEGL